MSRDTDKNLFIVSSMPGFYQQILGGIGSYQELGNHIIRQIKAAHAFRQVERVRELASLLVNIPIKEYQLIAQYYLVWCQCRKSHYDAATLERIVEQTRTYKAKALISRAAFEVYGGHMSEALHFYTEALRTNPTLPDYIKASTGIATVKSMEGFHHSALIDLESLLPLLRHAEPLNYFEVANSYAVELGEAGRKEEARNVIRDVLASPFALVYPECQETARDLKEPSHSLVTVPSIEREAVRVIQHASTEAKPSKPGRVVPFPPLKEVPPPKKPDMIDSQEFADMSLADKREFILAAVRTQLLPESEYDKMVFMLSLVKSGPADHVIDLEDKKTLDDLMVEWAHLIEPEQLAAVISALRDCEDDQRRVTIMDNMISRVFEYSRTRNITESEWRLKYERRLPKK